MAARASVGGGSSAGALDGLSKPIDGTLPAMAFDKLSITKLTGNESFHVDDTRLPLNVLAFWQWSSSDLVSNAMRGVLAEFLVAADLGVNHTPRIEWDSCDLRTPHGLKVEVKSAAYLQSWTQAKLSHISFDIEPKQGWDAATNTSSTERKRQADVYVFALLSHQDKATLDPLDLAQWQFFVLPSLILDEKLPQQKTMRLSTLLRLKPVQVKFGSIRTAIENVFNLV